MNNEALKEYISELIKNAKEVKANPSADIFDSGRKLAFMEALGILKRYYMVYEPDADLSDLGLDIDLEKELI